MTNFAPRATPWKPPVGGKWSQMTFYTTEYTILSCYDDQWTKNKILDEKMAKNELFSKIAELC